MIGRALMRLPVRSRLLRSPPSQCQRGTTLRAPFVLTIRAYATPGRPKRVVGEPSRPVKRAVKKKAAQPADGSSTAEKQVAAKKRTAAKKTRQRLTPEQAAAKKTEATATMAAKKAAAKLRTQKQREAAKVETEKIKVKELKQAALSPPPKSHVSAYNVFVSEKMKQLLSQRQEPTATERLCAASRENARLWKDAAAADIEHYNHMANQKNEAVDAEYKRWVESHGPEVILAANNARAALRRRIPAKGGRHSQWPPINDARRVKRPVTAYLLFSHNRLASGDFKNISFPERAGLLSREWRELNDVEKKKYFNLSRQDLNRYTSEYTDAYGRPPPHVGGQ